MSCLIIVVAVPPRRLVLSLSVGVCGQAILAFLKLLLVVMLESFGNLSVFVFTHCVSSLVVRHGMRCPVGAGRLWCIAPTISCSGGSWSQCYKRCWPGRHKSHGSVTGRLPDIVLFSVALFVSPICALEMSLVFVSISPPQSYGFDIVTPYSCNHRW